jgi:hypothetical protein
MTGPVEVPSLDSLAADHSKVFGLPPDVARVILGALSGLLPPLVAQAGRDTGQTDAPATPERWLTVEQVVSQFGVKKRWLYRHKRQLPHSQPSQKVLLFPEGKLRKWFAARKTG